MLEESIKEHIKKIIKLQPVARKAELFRVALNTGSEPLVAHSCASDVGSNFHRKPSDAVSIFNRKPSRIGPINGCFANFRRFTIAYTGQIRPGLN